jgi:hypothetical protein
MPRPRQRVCLEAGLKLDINKLPRRLFRFEPGVVWHHNICWTERHSGKTVANGVISTQVQSERAGWFRIQMGELDQHIDLVAQPRRFGGHQWYFRSPVTGRRCSVLWMPPCARRFCGRQEWGRRVAYASQFGTPVDRAHRGKARIKAKLIGAHDPDEWDLPPKPKWMRWHTYARHVQKFDHYEGVLQQQCALSLNRFKTKLGN